MRVRLRDLLRRTSALRRKARNPDARKKLAIVATLGARLKAIARPPYRAARSLLVVDHNGDWRKAVFVSSGARTGSTWVSQLINFNNEYRYLYEPFFIRPLGGPGLRERLPDNRIQYIAPDDDNPELVAQAEFILSGRFKHPHVDQYNARIIAGKRLVKEVKSNLWAYWLKRRFPALPVILLLRHPIPTIASRFPEYFSADAAGRTLVDRDPAHRNEHYRTLVFGQPELTRDHLAPLRDVLESAQTIMEQRMAVWCIQNYVPLRQFAQGQVYVTFYEQFCVDAENEIRRIWRFLGKQVNDAGLARFLDRVRLPSSNSRYKGKTLDGNAMVSAWMKRVTREDTSAAQRMLHAFGLDALYAADEPLPNVAALDVMLRAGA